MTNNNQNLVDAVRTLGQLLLFRGAVTSFGVYDQNSRKLRPGSKKAFRFSYFGGMNRICSTFRGKAKFSVFSTLLDECCDRVVGKAVLPFMWEDAAPATRKRWATKLANYAGK